MTQIEAWVWARPDATRTYGARVRIDIGGGTRLEVLDDCGHGTCRDRPDATEVALREFLAAGTVS